MFDRGKRARYRESLRSIVKTAFGFVAEAANVFERSSKLSARHFFGGRTLSQSTARSLVREHWRLIFITTDDISAARLASGEFQSVGFPPTTNALLIARNTCRAPADSTSLQAGYRCRTDLEEMNTLGLKGGFKQRNARTDPTLALALFPACVGPPETSREARKLILRRWGAECAASRSSHWTNRGASTPPQLIGQHLAPTRHRVTSQKSSCTPS